MSLRMMLGWVAAVLLTASGCATQQASRREEPAGGSTSPTRPQTDEQKTLYTLGLTLGVQIQLFELTREELQYVKAGLETQVLGEKPAVDLHEFRPQLTELARTRTSARAGMEKEKARAFLEQAAKEEGAIRTESGLVFQSIQAGTGESPGSNDFVKVRYRGTLRDGKEFDSSDRRDEPAMFPLDSVITCWTEGVQLMKVGGKARLVCPPELGYGDRGTPGIPGGSVLIFDVELLEVIPKPEE